MSRASQWTSAALLAGSVTAVSGAALGWGSPEHTEMGQLAFQMGCVRHRNLPACDRVGRPDWYNQHVLIARRATKEADDCHSFYFTDIAIEMNGTDAATRRHCAIIDGKPYTDPGPYTTAGTNQYLLYTNKQHFGDHTRPHADMYRALALEAANRYRTKPPLSDAARTCSAVAIGLAGYANHYVTDRTASGHAWTPAGHGFSWEKRDLYSAGMTGCFHAQPNYVRWVLKTTTGFDCVDNAAFGDRVYVGLGGEGRWFGGAFYDDNRQWYSDDSWTSKVNGSDGSFLQRSQTLHAAQIMNEVMTAMEAGTFTPNYVDTFVSNMDMCRVAVAECCRSFDASTNCGSWADPNVAVTARCDYCLPDITHDRLMEKCPFKQIRLNTQNNRGVWVRVDGASTWRNYYPGAANPDWKGNYQYSVELDRPQGDWNGVNAARGLAASEVGTLHPDARWDRDNDIISLLGCTK